MNQEANRLAMEATNYANYVGFGGDGSTSSLDDSAKLWRVLVEDVLFGNHKHASL